MYDPMLDSSPGCGLDYPSSYWADVSTANVYKGENSNKPEDDGALEHDITVDVAKSPCI